MPREVVALVSADDAVATIRVYADRVHDLLRRSGGGADESVEVTETYAFALLDALVNAPETVGDMAGWWFGRALELGRRLGDAAAEPPDEHPASVLAGTETEERVRAALADLPESERAAVVLRDAYDLPPQAVAVALRRDEPTADALVAAGRLHLVARYGERRAPDLAGHTGRTPADLAALSRLADGTLASPKTVPMRRHLGACMACEDTVDALARGRRLAAGLPVIAMPDDAREAMLERVTARASTVLPSVDDVLLAVEQDDDVRPAISPLVVVLAIAAALLLGVAIAAVTRSGSGSPLAAVDVPTAPPSTVQPSFSVAPTPTASATPRRTASARPTATTHTARPRPSASRSVTVHPQMTVSPTSGPRGTTITVSGTGWAPGDSIAVRYSGPVNSVRTAADADAGGRWSVTITADGLVPGQYTITAGGSSGQTSARFTQTS